MARFRHLTGQHAVRSNPWPVALALAFVLSNLLSWNHLGLGLPAGGSASPQAAQAAPRPDGGGQAAVGRPVAGKPLQVHWSKAMPTPSAQERQAEQAVLKAARQLKPPPVGPIYHPTAADTTALARTAGPPLPTPRTASRTTPGAPHADSDFNIEQAAVVSSGGICSACGLSTEMDASVTNSGGNVLMVGNYFAASSPDSGSTWIWGDPYSIASGMGLGSPISQQMVYEPSHATYFWALDGYGGPGASTNGIGLVADASNSWNHTFSPPAFGLPTGDAFNNPDIEYSANYLYLSFDAYNASGNFVGSYVARLPVSPLASPICGSVTPQYVWRSDNYHFTLAQGATDTMYWMSNFYVGGTITNGNHVRVFFWPESSNSYTYQDKQIDPFNILLSGNCASQDGVVTNWCPNLNSTVGTLYRSRAGYRGFGAPMLGMAWGAGPVNGVTSFPYVVREYFLLSNMAYEGHDNVWSSYYAVAYPSLAAPTARGYVGGVFSWGGGVTVNGNPFDYYPANLLLIEDPDTPTQPWSIDTWVAGHGAGYGNGVWGDYNTARPWTPDGLHWIAGGWRITQYGVVEAYVAIFGRGRDHNAYLRWANT